MFFVLLRFSRRCEEDTYPAFCRQPPSAPHRTTKQAATCVGPPPAWLGAPSPTTTPALAYIKRIKRSQSYCLNLLSLKAVPTDSSVVAYTFGVLPCHLFRSLTRSRGFAVNVLSRRPAYLTPGPYRCSLTQAGTRGIDSDSPMYAVLDRGHNFSGQLLTAGRRGHIPLGGPRRRVSSLK